MKAYVVFCSTGEYSDFRAWVGASFDSRMAAERYVAGLEQARARFFDFKCQRSDCGGWYKVPIGIAHNRLDIFAAMVWPDLPTEKRYSPAGCRCPERPVFSDPIKGPIREYVEYSVVEVESNPASNVTEEL
jgi:hypothetical protein